MKGERRNNKNKEYMQKEKTFYNLGYDRIFKTIVTNPEDTRLLNLILSDVLDKKVRVIRFIPNELKVRNKKERTKITDVIVETQDGKHIIVEINSSYDKVIKIRNLSYFTSYYSQEVMRGEEYKDEIKMIQINLNYNQSKKDIMKRHYYIRSEEDDKRYTDTFEIIEVNVASYKYKCYDECIKGRKEHIYIVLLDANEEEIEELGKKDKIVKEYGEKVYELNEDGVLVTKLTREEDLEKIYKTRIWLASKEGIKEGKKSGIKEGIKEGKIDSQREIALKMLDKGMKINEISEITGLNKKEIEQICKK